MTATTAMTATAAATAATATSATATGPTRTVTLPDAYWASAANAALRALDEAEHVLVPAEFLPLDPRFAPLEYAWGLEGSRTLAWCCSKDDVDRIAPWLLEAHGADPSSYPWANEVFVLGGNFRWRRSADAASRRHLVAWFERVERYRRGEPARASAVRPADGIAKSARPLADAMSSNASPARRVLIVGASGMGNAGDDLLAGVLAELCAEAGVDAYLSGPDIDPLDVADYDAVVVGGGGLVYASRDGANEAQNLANYLKFGPIGRHFGVPVAMIGVGDQERRGAERAGGPTLRKDPLTKRFARSALACFDRITTRDAQSTSLLDSFGAAAETGSDLLFHWTARARAAVKPSALQPGRIALVGELYRHSAIVKGFGNCNCNCNCKGNGNSHSNSNGNSSGNGNDNGNGNCNCNCNADGNGRLAPRLQDGDFDVVVMSKDDVRHAERMRDALQRAGASASIVDVRDHSFEALVFLFASYGAVVTTRFHGLVVAMLAGVPVLALDRPAGKCARLLRAIDARRALLLDGAPNGVARLRAALDGELAPIPADRVDGLAQRCEVHREAIGALLGARPPERAARAAPRSRASRQAFSSAPAAKGNARSTPADRARTCVAAPPDGGPRAAYDAARLPETGTIPLTWAASNRSTAGFANLGDSLSAVMVAALSGRPVQHVDFDAPGAKLVAVGSIGHAIRNGTAVVWGTGVSIRGGTLARNVPHTRYDIRAVRGPISAGHYRDFGLRAPDVFGDPAWLLPSIVDGHVEPRYELGVIPHIRDVSTHHPDAPPRADSLRCRVDAVDAAQIVVINTWHEPTWDGLLAKLRLIRSCKRILSQSFHGLVIAEAYGIPALNFRSLPGANDGAVRIDLEQRCNTDPRVWEFYKGGLRPFFYTYSQRRECRSDWDGAIRAIDTLWEPFEYDPTPLVQAFPLPLAYDPLRERPSTMEHVNALRF